MALLTGFVILLLGIVHIVYGETVQIPGMKGYIEDPVMTGSLRVMIYQGGVILLAVGAVQVLKGLGRLRLIGAAAFFPLGVIVLNIITFLAISLVFEPALISISFPQLAVFIIVIALMSVELKVAGRRRTGREGGGYE